MDERRETTNHRLYEIDRRYKWNTNLIKYIDEAQDFYNGDHYPNANYNNMIRVTMNICSMMATIKASKICGTPIYLTFTADDGKTDCTALRQFDEYNQGKMHIKSSNYQAALNGFVNGTEVTLILWDEDDTSYKGIYKGGLVEEHIDLRNFAVANPYIQDIQNQKWVMFWEDYEIGALKELVEGKTKEEIEEKRSLIEREGANEDEYKDKESINHSLARMYTRFFRVNGEVYFMCSTKTVDLFAYPHPLSRTVGEKIIKKVVDEYRKSLDRYDSNENADQVQDYAIDYEDMIIQSYRDTEMSQGEYEGIKEKFSLYPFAVFRPFSQNRSFYGRSDIKSLIPIQKGLNFAISMMLKCAENNAYNKIFAKPDALQGQEITNEPSQVILDYSGFTNAWGIKFAESQPLPNGLIDFANSMMGMTRVVYGFNDVMDGTVTNKDMSGYMLQQMIKQANTSIEQQQQIFWEYNEDKAAIRTMYYKHYVDSARYTFEYSDAEMEEQETARRQLYAETLKGNGIPTNPNARPEDFSDPTRRVQVREFDGKSLWGVGFDISIDAMQGTSDSKLVEQQMWDNLLLNGGIQNISPDILAMYLSASPNVSMRTKTSLQKVVDNLKMQENTQLKNKLQEVASSMEEVTNYAKKLEGQLGYQSQYIKNLHSEFTEKINNSNKIIGAMMQDRQRQMTEGEIKSNNATSTERQEAVQQ